MPEHEEIWRDMKELEMTLSNIEKYKGTYKT